MRKIAFTRLAMIGAAFGAITLPAAAFAQSNDDPKVEPYIGLSAGIHDIGLGFDGDDGGIYGVVAGVDVPVGETIFVGAEANYHFGDGIIDSEYGIAARAGVRVGDSAKLFVRGGYQEVDFDIAQILGGNRELLLPQTLMLQIGRRADFPMASALAMVLMSVVVMVLTVMHMSMALLLRCR